MWPDEAQLILRKSHTFQTIHSTIVSNQHEDQKLDIDIIGTIIYDGKLAWTANGAYLEVISVDSGNKLAVFDFDRLLGTNDSYISCVSEIHIPGVKSCCLAVGLQLTPSGGKICVISIQGSCVLGMIDFFDKVTTCHYVPKRQSDHSLRSLLRCFDGCLAVGTDQGKVILLDLCFKRCKFVIDGLLSTDDNLEVQQCHVIFANADPEEIMEHHEQSKQDDIYFGIQLEVLENAGHVQSIVVIPFSMTLVAGLEDGRMILYDLENLQAFHLAYPPEKSAPLLCLSYLEPADDPRACIYVWALHASKNGGIGVMHSIMFQHKYIDRTETVYRNFLSCSPRLTMPMFDKHSYPVACHSFTKLIDEEEEQQVTLCAIVWTTKSTGTLMVFDLNQWYKEQMPEVGDWRRFPTYTAIFPLGDLNPLDLCLDQNMLVPFNSIQRPEEHFYPNSLSFDVSILTRNTIMTASWPGLQKLVLDTLVKAGSKAILEPSKYVKEMINAALIPQYQDFNIKLPMGIDLKREFLLTIALEYNCITFLKKLAVAIADGSHIGNVPTEALGLSTVTDWIWNRARSLKDMSNSYTVPLFDYSGRTIDCGMQKSLTLCTRQLRIVANLMELICTECEQYIPEHVHKILVNQLQSIQLASDYQEAIQWLLNVGLLPEGVWRSESHVSSQPDEPMFVPYPYHLINSYYSTQRMKLSVSNENRLNTPSPFVYIDTFIEHSCDMQAITDLWKEQGGCGLYPPVSLQKMMRVLLIPDIPIEAKQILFVYLFMDINHVLSDGRYGPVVQNLIKFPAVFKMDPATIKVTQSFWYLDHGDLDTSIEELISPLSQSHNLKQWQRDFLITNLLKQDAPHLALRLLKAPGVPVEASLELRTLLSNDLVSEAFKFQRAKGDKRLLAQFFEGAMKIQKRDLLLDLSLNEEESKTLIEFLGEANISLTENLHFVYLLQRSDFVDAVSLVDKLMKSTRDRSYDLNVPREILTIYHKTLEPTSRQLTYLAYSHPDKFQLKKFKEVPKPLSSSLIRQKLDPAAGIYQRSILSVKEAGSKEMFEDDEKHERSLPFLRRSGLGTFSFEQKTQTNNVVYPQIVNRNQDKKRQLDDDRDKHAIQFNEYEGPRKRRRFDESDVPRKSIKDYDVSVLSRFNPKNKPKFNFTEGNESIQFSAANERTPEKVHSASSISPSTLLRTPIVEKAHRDESPDRNRFTPQSILKSASHASLPRSVTPLSYVSRKSFESEEKSIRFAIPGSSADTSLNSSFLQLSSQTLNTTHEKTFNESIVSKAEFYSADTSLVDDQTMTGDKLSVKEAIRALDQMDNVDRTIETGTEEQMNVSEGHEDLSFLADAPHPRPPIRSCSSSSHSGSPRSSRSHSRSVSPGIRSAMVTRSKSRELEAKVQHEPQEEEKQPKTPDSTEKLEPTTSIDSDKTSTPIVPLSQKRSQKSLGRAVLEKNLKQQLMSDIFGEYSKTSQVDETVEHNPELSVTSETDMSDIGFLSYEQSGILTGDTLVDQQILKKMIGHESLASSFGEPTMGDSTLRMLNASSTILSDSSNYEDSRDDLSVPEVKEASVVLPVVEESPHSGSEEQTIPQDESAQIEELVPQPESAPQEERKYLETAQDEVSVESPRSEAISIGDSEESDIGNYDETDEDDSDVSDESEDKFANVSENDNEEPEHEMDEEELEEEYFEEDEEHEQSDLSRESSFSSDSTEGSTPQKPSADDDEVISIGSTSEEDDDDNIDDAKHFEEIAHNISSEPEMTHVNQVLPAVVINPIALTSEPEIDDHFNESNTLNQGLIMSHMETAHEHEPSEYQLPTTIPQSLLYYDVEVPSQPVSQMNEAQMSDLLYGEVEVETDTDSLNLAIVEDDIDASQEMPAESVEKEDSEEPVEQPKLPKVKSKIIEVKKSEVANTRFDIIKEVYDETVVQPDISMVEEEVEELVVIPVVEDVPEEEQVSAEPEKVIPFVDDVQEEEINVDEEKVSTEDIQEEMIDVHEEEVCAEPEKVIPFTENVLREKMEEIRAEPEKLDAEENLVVSEASLVVQEEEEPEVVQKDSEQQQVPIQEDIPQEPSTSKENNVPVPNVEKVEETEKKPELIEMETQEKEESEQMETDDSPNDVQFAEVASSDIPDEPQPAPETNATVQPEDLQQSEEAAIQAWLTGEGDKEESKELIEGEEPTVTTAAAEKPVIEPEVQEPASVEAKNDEPSSVPVSQEKQMEMVSTPGSPEKQVELVSILGSPEKQMELSSAPGSPEQKVELVPAPRSPEKHVELVVEMPKEENLVTSSSEDPTAQPATATVEIVITEPEPSTSTEPDGAKRMSLYPDPLDKTSFFPQPDDGVEIDVLNETNIYDFADDAKTLPRKLRSRAQSFDQKPSALDSPIVKRSLRATSVPKSSELQDVKSTPRKLRRISVDTHQLEHIEEGAPLEIASTPKRRTVTTASNSGTPSMLTRSASRRLSTEVVQEPTTPSRATRGSSKEVSSARIKARRITDTIEEEDVDTPDHQTTPSRITRGSSKEVSGARIQTRRITDTVEEEEVETPDLPTPPARKTRQISLSSKKSDEMDDNKSEISVKSTRSTRRAPSSTDDTSKRSTRTRGVSVSSTETSPPLSEGSHETYSQSRRLTRRQQAMMEKLSQQAQSLPSVSTATQDDDQSEEEISDSESVVSQRSTVSTKSKQSTASKRSTKSKRVTKSKSAPTTRTTRSSSKTREASQGTRKRKATKPVHLDVIPEEDKASTKSTSSDEPDIPEEVPVKRTRKTSRK